MCVCTIVKGDQLGFLLWQIPLPVHLLPPDAAAFCAQHVWEALPGQVPEAVATGILRDHAKSGILVQGHNLLIETLSLSVFSTLDVCGSLGVWL